MMDRWYWTLLLVFCSFGVLLFLRIVANEAWAIHRAMEFLAAEKRKQEDEVVELEVQSDSPPAPPLKGTPGAGSDAA